jgi:hypothetical protein
LVSHTHVAIGAERLVYRLSPTKDGISIEPAGVGAGFGNAEFTPILGAFVKNKATEDGAWAITWLDKPTYVIRLW